MARFTVAVAPGTLLIFFSTRATQDAQVIPPTARSMVPMTARASGMPAGACEPWGVAGAGAVCWPCVMVTVLVARKGGVRVFVRSDQRARWGDRVAGLFDGGLDVLVGERLGGADRHLRGAAVHQLDLDVRDAREGCQLLGDRADAVAAGHALDADVDGLGAHGVPPCGGALICGRCQLRTRRAMASAASRTFSSPAAWDSRAAFTTQWPRWSSSKRRLTAWNAFVTAETWVRMSMQ